MSSKAEKQRLNQVLSEPSSEAWQQVLLLSMAPKTRDNLAKSGSPLLYILVAA